MTLTAYLSTVIAHTSTREQKGYVGTFRTILRQRVLNEYAAKHKFLSLSPFPIAQHALGAYRASDTSTSSSRRPARTRAATCSGSCLRVWQRTRHSQRRAVRRSSFRGFVQKVRVSSTRSSNRVPRSPRQCLPATVGVLGRRAPPRGCQTWAGEGAQARRGAGRPDAPDRGKMYPLFRSLWSSRRQPCQHFPLADAHSALTASKLTGALLSIRLWSCPPVRTDPVQRPFHRGIYVEELQEVLRGRQLALVHVLRSRACRLACSCRHAADEGRREARARRMLRRFGSETTVPRKHGRSFRASESK